MNIKKERELFEEAYCKVQMITGGGDTFSTYPNGDYIRQSLHLAWLMWLASRNREGYVLVPIEPKEDVLLLMCDEVCADFKDMENAYKAMIGTCDD